LATVAICLAPSLAACMAALAGPETTVLVTWWRGCHPLLFVHLLLLLLLLLHHLLLLLFAVAIIYLLFLHHYGLSFSVFLLRDSSGDLSNLQYCTSLLS
jgi:hypothetical protein